MVIESNEALIQYIAKGNSPKYIYFWGHQKPKTGVSKSCFSQWYASAFEEDGIRFLTAEHYMMYHKAMLFDNCDIAKKVIACSHPGEAKKLGREVVGFDQAIWEQSRFDIVVQANYLKFSQHSELKAFLQGTGNRVLVEASPVDPIWGVGLAVDNEAITQPENWQGLNLLGYALMRVRERLRDEQ